MVALWVLPSLLARHPSQGITAAQRLAAINAIRTTTVTFLVAVGAAVTVWFTARTYSLSREGHVTDRYTSAVSQLGSVSPYVRVGGIYALERIGHEFLVGNWKSIRWGRPLEIWTGPDGQPGHQLVTPIGRLDFLCTDPQTGALVVVELKRGRPSDKVVGQAARYMGYVRTHLAKPGQSVEGLIVAHEAEEALRYAVAAFLGLQLTTYEVTFQLSTVEEPTGF